eukprot:1550136-Heterocapsa_arctica.AAC.1
MASHPSNDAMLSIRKRNSGHSASFPVKLGVLATPHRSTNRAATSSKVFECGASGALGCTSIAP